MLTTGKKKKKEKTAEDDPSCDKHYHPGPNKEVPFDYEYVVVEETVDPELDSFDLEEEEYIEFLKQYGHVDFSNIDWTPDLRTVQQYEEIYQEEFVKIPKMQRAFKHLGNKFDFDKLRDNGHMIITWTKKKPKMKD